MYKNQSMHNIVFNNKLSLLLSFSLVYIVYKTFNSRYLRETSFFLHKKYIIFAMIDSIKWRIFATLFANTIHQMRRICCPATSTVPKCNSQSWGLELLRLVRHHRPTFLMIYLHYVWPKRTDVAVPAH